MKAADYGMHTKTVSAFVSTNSICQGQQVPILWPLIFQNWPRDRFRPYILQMGKSCKPQCGCDGCYRRQFQDHRATEKSIFTIGGGTEPQDVPTSNSYLSRQRDNTTFIQHGVANQRLRQWTCGNYAKDGGHLLLVLRRMQFCLDDSIRRFIRPMFGGSQEFIRELPMLPLDHEDDIGRCSESHDSSEGGLTAVSRKHVGE